MSAGRPPLQGVRVSAPGKIILFGEHSVVYGKRALACSLGLRTELTLTPSADAVSLHLPEIAVEETWSLQSLNRLWEQLKRNKASERTKQPCTLTDEEETILKSFLGLENKNIGKRELGLIAFFHLYTAILPQPVPFAISVKSQMPVGSGLGSSAAYAVCLAGLLQYLSGKLKPTDFSSHHMRETSASLGVVCEWALCCEKILHGTPSGIDNAVCTYGGAVSFKSGKVQQLTLPALRIMLVNTCISRNTKTLVARVREKHDRLESVIDPILASMDNLAESAIVILNEMRVNSLSKNCLNAKLNHLQELIDINQCLLGALGVSHPSLDRLIAIAKSHGLYAKLTGAGGGGFGFILLSSDVSQEVINACTQDIKKEGFETWVTDLGGEGLTMSPVK